MESIDCVVVGAGWYGLVAAKHYQVSQPDHSVAILDSQSTIGGTWAEERLYPGLKTNNLFGTYQYPDFPMESGKFGAEPGRHIPGRAVHEYLKSYAAKFDLTSLIRLNTKVITAEHQETNGGWIITTQHNGEKAEISTRKLIVATGLTSEPNLASFVGQDKFGGRIFHGRDFPQNRDTISAGRAVTVYGSTKFAWDAVYAYATAGTEVHWIIRASGHGPCWMTPPYVTPLKQMVEHLANTRLLTWFSPCIWGSQDGYPWIRRLLHGTMVGRFVVDSFWKILSGDVLNLCGFDSHPETKKLKPKIDAMFAGTSFSILNYDTDFFDLVKNGQVKIHIAEIDHLSPGIIHLSDGSSVKSDSMLVHTGWKRVPPIKFLPDGIEAELGIPHERNAALGKHDLASNKSLLDRADQEILSQFPRLKNQPHCLKEYVPLSNVKGTAKSETLTEYNKLTPFMLHRYMVPPSEKFLRHRDVAFCGMVQNFSTAILAHTQSLWIAAFMSHRLDRDPASDVSKPEALEELQYQTLLNNRFGKWRYPVDWGNKAPAFVFDAVPYYDLLLRDLGLKFKRKSGLLSELFQAYGPEDYRETSLEWVAKQRALDKS